MLNYLQNSKALRSLALVAASVLAAPAHASFVVAPGFDLLFTREATFNFPTPGGTVPVAFEGVPLGPFDFGSGPESVGATDTILQRLQAADGGGAGGTDTVPIEIVALSLRSVDPVDLGFGPELLDVILHGDTGSTMSITFADMLGGTFDSNLSFDIQFQGIDSGALTNLFPVSMVQTGSTWGRVPGSSNVLIPSVNFQLNGVNGDEDFFTGIARHGPDHIHETIDINNVPEPGALSLALTGLGLTLVGRISRRRRTRR